MNITPITNYVAQMNVQSRVSTSGLATPVNMAATVASSSTVVTLGSGYDVMLSRLFHVNGRADEPPVEYNRDLSSGSV
ncbi:MAG: hypothetical protein LBJ59_10715 [Zoogloeaceae bacterium]|nr:hypothetical protein [Zoogloeaceae bacterium]